MTRLALCALLSLATLQAAFIIEPVPPAAIVTPVGDQFTVGTGLMETVPADFPDFVNFTLPVTISVADDPTYRFGIREIDFRILEDGGNVGSMYAVMRFEADEAGWNARLSNIGADGTLYGTRFRYRLTFSFSGLNPATVNADVAGEAQYFIPEPSAFILTVTGIIGVLIARRRRNTKSPAAP